MRHVRMLGLGLIAVVALTALAASSAMAGPQWVKCDKVGSGGKYTGPNCTKAEKAKPAGSGTYELYKAHEVEAKRKAEGKSPSIPFSGGNLGAGGVLSTQLRACSAGNGESETRTTRAGCAAKGYHEGVGLEVIEIECESEHNTGEVAGANVVQNVSVKFTGCKLFGAAPCTNGATEGEINVNTLTGKLGYISKSEHKVGVLLEPAKKKSDFASFTCAGVVGVVVGAGNDKEGAEYTSSGCSGLCPGTTPAEEKHGGYDGIISPITPVNTMTTEFTQAFTINHANSQNIPSKFEGKHIDLLESYLYNPERPALSLSWGAAGEEITNVNVAEEAGEIQA